jgi:hypothetical protein
MNWGREIEIDLDTKARGSITLADLLDWVLASVTKEDAEIFAEQLIQWAEIQSAEPLWEE